MPKYAIVAIIPNTTKANIIDKIPFNNFFIFSSLNLKIKLILFKIYHTYYIFFNKQYLYFLSKELTKSLKICKIYKYMVVVA